MCATVGSATVRSSNGPGLAQATVVQAARGSGADGMSDSLMGPVQIGAAALATAGMEMAKPAEGPSMPAVEGRGARDSALNPYALPWHPRSYWYQLCVAYEERAGDMHNIRAVDVEENAGGCLESGSGTGPQQRARAPTIITASPNPTGEGQGPPAWAQCSETRGKVLRVLDELVWWFNETGREQYTPEVPVAEADTAEDVKQYFLKYYPRGRPGGGGKPSHMRLSSGTG